MGRLRGGGAGLVYSAATAHPRPRAGEARRNLKTALDQLSAKGFLLFEGLTGPRGWDPWWGSPPACFALSRAMSRVTKNLPEKVEHLDHATLRIAGCGVMADPLDQARRAAAGLYEMLAAEGLDTVPVQPMVIFPGWAVDRPDTFSDPGVIITGEQSLEAEIRQGDARMEPRDVVIAVSLLLEKTARAPRLPDYVAA